MKGIDERKIPLSIFLYLSKAFDTLDHKILLSKVQHYSIHNTSLNWFHSYMTERKQYVMPHQNVYPFIQVYHRDLFCAFYFSSYMNDISVVSSKFSFILYADDTTMASSMCTFTDTSSQGGSTMSNKINEEIVNVSDWLLYNKLSHNVSKTKVMLFHNYQNVLSDTEVPKLKIDDSEIEKLTGFNFLGLTINEYLDWTSHSNKIAHKISV